MWKNLPLNIKILSALIMVQATVLGLSVAWMSAWISTTRLKELQTRLEIQSDAIEGGIGFNETPMFRQNDEIILELSKDHNFYYLIIKQDGSILAQGLGESLDFRQELRERLQTEPQIDSVKLIEILGKSWLVHTEIYAHPANSNFGKLVIYSATNAQLFLDEMSSLKHSMTLAALGILLLTSLGSGAVVSVTTRNLRSFSNQLKSLQPPLFEGEINLSPQSAEEKLLFTTYHDLLKAVRSSAKAQRLFLANASHEIKTPIAASLSALEVTLSQKRSAREYEQTCQDVLAEMRLLKRLSTLLLNLAQLEAETCETKETVLLSTILREGRWKNLAAQKSISIHSNYAGIEQVSLKGSHEHWEIILGNLIQNSLNYGHKGGFVKLSAQIIGNNRCQIGVQDNGIGMSEEDLSHLGQLFYRADQSRTSNSSFGLGFALAKRIIESLGGQIEVQSQKGVGTLMTITAPIMVLKLSS